MGGQAISSKLGTAGGSPARAPVPDPYPNSSQEDLPKTDNHTVSTPNTPSHGPPFPAIMNAYGQWGKIRGFNLCGATEKDRLCHVEMHTGYSGNPPLGTRPGVVLHHGKDSKAPVLAAAGYDSYRAASSYAFNNKSVILMPPLLSGGESGEGGLWKCRCRLCERFAWWKVGKGTDDAAKEGGFKLVALPPSQAADSSGQGDTSSVMPTDAHGGEVLAFLMWRRLFPKFKHAFTLELRGGGQSGELGERWSLMVVITALRIWALRLNGKTKRGVIAAE
ncbi:hypothetical protein B0I37DRAFT_439562 [Chaetomium sp. MPI-CAGE-AT-0009]|nr:hypothetical protein B0I37DRAFT_439562 [Chaetomium sp. MPI-CAGE-AT-0009]